MKPGTAWTLIPAFLLSGCAVFQQNPKYGFANGVYASKVMGGGKVYVENREDEIRVYAVQKGQAGFFADSLRRKPVSFGAQEMDSVLGRPTFLQTSFDADVLTIPFKYRFSAAGFPRQFTTQLNGGLYLGYRSDLYVLRYGRNPLGVSSRQTDHIGISFGGFTGIGSTTMNPWVARDRIAIEYEGVAWSKGLAAIAGLNNFTAGVALGWDHLLDRNRVHWIYQGRPWVGFVFGLNLN